MEAPSLFLGVETRLAVVARAKTALEISQDPRGRPGTGVVYKLGRGGWRPERGTPWNTAGELDCSGFVAWCLGICRQTDAIPGGWIETTMIFQDATSTQKVFQRVTTGACPGDVLVWPDTRLAGRVLQGHTGIVTLVTDGVPSRVVHCSGRNFKTTGNALAETSAGMFLANRAITIRLKHHVGCPGESKK